MSHIRCPRGRGETVPPGHSAPVTRFAENLRENNPERPGEITVKGKREEGGDSVSSGSALHRLFGRTHIFSIYNPLDKSYFNALLYVRQPRINPYLQASNPANPYR